MKLLRQQEEELLAMQAMLDSRQQSHREKVSALRYNKNPFKSTIKEAVPE